jgi:hypothetical protein
MYMQYRIIVMISIIRLILVLPVPVTAFRHIVETDIKRMATPTILRTGIPSAKNSSLVLNNERISFVKSSIGRKINSEDPTLSKMIRLINGRTFECKP